MDLLVLLIGENNVSNYALMKFFQKEDEFKFDKVMLVYTKQTQNNAEYIKNLSNVDFIDLNVEDVKDYFLEVKNLIKTKLENLDINKLILDFTGGLKSMSLGAYLAVDEIDIENKYISYVTFERKKSKIVLKRGEEFKLNENLSIEEIAGVHGVFDLKSKDKNSEFFNYKNVKFLLSKIENEEKEFFIDLWDKKDLKNRNWIDSIKDVDFNVDLFSLSNRKLKKLQNYIKGEFLEEYIFALLKEIQKEINLHEIKWNVKQGQDAKFEVDVVVSKNNNLYLFSCTSDKSKSRVKQKGFEAKDRAKKIGGIYARTILVSCVSKKEREKLKIDLIDKKDKVLVDLIMFEDLLDKEKLKQILKQIIEEG